MRSLDFSSWSGLLSTVLGLALITLLGVGIRLLVMQSVQQRRERENRQINERLRTLIAAYRTLGGSFTGDLAVDPAHLRDILSQRPGDSFDRPRRIRDAVEAALSDILLLGTEDQVRLAASAANDLAAGRSVHTDELVTSLRTFIRQVLDLEPIAADVQIPKQGPVRPSSTRGGGKSDSGDKDGGKSAGNKGLDAGGAAGAGVGMGVGLNLGSHSRANDQDEDPRPQD
jgi:heme exporter protein D